MGDHILKDLEIELKSLTEEVGEVAERNRILREKHLMLLTQLQELKEDLDVGESNFRCLNDNLKALSDRVIKRKKEIKDLNVLKKKNEYVRECESYLEWKGVDTTDMLSKDIIAEAHGLRRAELFKENGIEENWNSDLGRYIVGSFNPRGQEVWVKKYPEPVSYVDIPSNFCIYGGAFDIYTHDIKIEEGSTFEEVSGWKA